NRVYADKNLAAMFELSAADADGGPLSAYLRAIHPEDRGPLQARLDSAIASGTTFISEHRLRKADGSERWVLARGQVIRDASGAAVRLPSVVLDISEQRRAEALLRKSEYRCRMALESAELGTWSVDPATMAMSTDARFREIFGVHQDDSLGYEDAVDLIHPEDREKVRQAVAASSREHDPIPYDVEYRVVRPDGSIRWVHAKGRANVTGASQGSDSVSFDGTLADVTARKHAEEEREHLLESERSARATAERAGRMKDEFLATLSHEIRTPLSAILGWAQIMRRSKSAADHTAGLEVIERNARAQTKIIEDMLDMSSIISGKVRLQMQEMDLAALIHVAVETARPTADAKQISLDVTINPVETVRMMGDANRLQQVLWNLLSNAIKFTPTGGSVEVSLSHSQSQLEICVADNGEGISADFLPFVFDRFRQADASTTRRHGGLGLGLSIVRQIAELHGGQVRVTSAGLGKGASFFVSLPIAGVEEIPEAPEPTGIVVTLLDEQAQSGAAGSIDGVRILVVDDEADAREMIARLLQEHGAAVTAAGSAAEAMQNLQRAKFDVLLCDISMPDEDGYSLIRRVRLLTPEQGGSIHAIALTAFARTED
ncbi:MAG TPA: PAS domain-containing protein, partial [Steroidobacteraceae bacterium]|nr:PAS domain-containing protein [Steroidobacteraceae bacterium]